MRTSTPGTYRSTSAPSGYLPSSSSNAAEGDGILDDVVLPDSLARALEVGLHDDGEGELVEAARPQGGPRDESTARARHTPPGELLLREGLVERHAERVRVTPGRGDAELLEQGGVEGASCLAPVALGEVEDDVRRERLESRDEERGGAGDVDALDPVARAREGPLDGGDGLAGIKLRFLLGVGDAKVVSQGNAHEGEGSLSTAEAPRQRPCAAIVLLRNRG
jgi:hypothetical protein